MAKEKTKKVNKTKYLRVIKTEYYDLTDLQQEDVDELKTEWFVKYGHTSHATRDGSKIGNADEILNITVLDEPRRLDGTLMALIHS